ncbi:hypothetical protein KW790_01295 [Candidatus Parcubacteria bacterium]|nr:hypothetical protein [Candidatus Parcubacteria bacterium]
MDPEKAPPSQQTHQESSGTLKQIRTFQGDIAEALKERQASVVTVAQAEQARKKTIIPQEAPGEGRKVFFLTLGTLILLALGVGGAWYAYGTYKTKTAPPIVEIPNNRLIPAQSQRTMNVSSLNLQSLVKILNSSERTKGVEQIQITPDSGTGFIPTSDFMNLIGATPPGALLRAFNPTFMLGILTDTKSHPFLLIKLDSFENAFPGMLEWEKIMSVDLLPLFASANEVTSVPPTAKFEDITIKNKDARVLRDINGQTRLLYSFFDSHILIITDNEETLRTLITKITGELLIR